MDWAATVEIVGVLLVLAILLPLIGLFIRRRWLARQGGMVDCSLRTEGAPRSGWTLGLARYNGEHLEWFPAISLAFNPRVRLRRTATNVVETRIPGEAEAVVLFHGQRIVSLRSTPDFGDTQVYELALDEGSLTGLLSWLEAAPPSVGRFRQ